jgi:hypothetical protein
MKNNAINFPFPLMETRNAASSLALANLALEKVNTLRFDPECNRHLFSHQIAFRQKLSGQQSG